MKPYNSFLLLFLTVTLIPALAACGGQQEDAGSGESYGHHPEGHAGPESHSGYEGHMGHGGNEQHSHSGHEGHVNLEPGEPSNYSIYHASGVWQDQNGEEMRLSD